MSRNIRTGLMIVLVCICIPFGAGAQHNTGYKIKTSGLTLQLSNDGTVMQAWFGKNPVGKPLNAYTEIQGNKVKGNVVSRRLKNGGVEFEKILENDSLQTSCTLVERFIPTRNSIRWEIAVQGNGQAQGGRISSIFNYPITNSSKFWAPWGHPQYDPETTDQTTLQQLAMPKRSGLPGGGTGWRDPLLPLPFTNTTLYYGAPPLDDKMPLIPYMPFRGDLIGIPMCSILDNAEQTGLTIALSPADNIIDLVLNTQHDGTVSFTRVHNRIPANTPATYSLDLVGGENDWRGGLGWMTQRYPEYFKPITQDALKFGGLGAYSEYTGEIDAARLKKLGFTVNWQATFDFPYMGMFLPPLKREEVWTNFRKNPSSMAGMDDYARRMRNDGFYVFNYFNVTEFGASVQYPPKPAEPDVAPKDRWRNSSRFLYDSLWGGAMRGSDIMDITWYKNKQPGGLFYSWEGCVAMDCGDPAYRKFLLEQADRHIKELPNSYGICIDRMDWLRLFNKTEDDGIAWYMGKPVRSLITSWKNLLDTLGPMMHNAGKSILVNNHHKRIDLLNHVDGIFDEFTYASSPLNLTALLCVQKPALGWTDGPGNITGEGIHNFFQKYLYMGVFPMAPYPGNDHALGADPKIEALYFQYAPLLAGMKNRSWVLESHVVSVKNEAALANIFATPTGYTIPVVYANEGTKEVEVTLRNIDLKKIASFVAYHPGKEEPVPLRFVRGKKSISVNVPVENACAMVVATYR